MFNPPPPTILKKNCIIGREGHPFFVVFLRSLWKDDFIVQLKNMRALKFAFQPFLVCVEGKDHSMGAKYSTFCSSDHLKNWTVASLHISSFDFTLKTSFLMETFWYFHNPIQSYIKKRKAPCEIKWSFQKVKTGTEFALFL